MKIHWGSSCLSSFVLCDLQQILRKPQKQQWGSAGKEKACFLETTVRRHQGIPKIWFMEHPLDAKTSHPILYRVLRGRRARLSEPRSQLWARSGRSEIPTRWPKCRLHEMGLCSAGLGPWLALLCEGFLPDSGFTCTAFLQLP